MFYKERETRNIETFNALFKFNQPSNSLFSVGHVRVFEATILLVDIHD